MEGGETMKGEIYIFLFFLEKKKLICEQQKRSVQQGLYPECPCQTEYLLRKSKHFLVAGAFTIRIPEGMLYEQLQRTSAKVHSACIRI